MYKHIGRRTLGDEIDLSMCWINTGIPKRAFLSEMLLLTRWNNLFSFSICYKQRHLSRPGKNWYAFILIKIVYRFGFVGWGFFQ